MTAAPLRILIIRPSALGDVCRTVSVLAALRRAWPDATIDWLVQDSFVDAVRGHPSLDGVIPFPRGRWRSWWRSASLIREVRGWCGSMRLGAYDLVLDCQGLARSAVASWSTRAPVRVVRARAREMAWLGGTLRVPDPAGADALSEMLALVEALGVPADPDPALHAPAEDVRWWRASREGLGLAGRFAAIAPTSRWPGKRWEPARWAEVARRLRARGLVVAAIGAPGEEAQVRDALDGVPGAVDLCGKLSIGRMMALLADASLAVAHDSAAVHIAAGMGCPYVGIFGPTDPERTGPWQGAPWCLWGGRGERLGAHAYRDESLGRALMGRVSVDAVMERCEARL
jgi:lipopolysaccharide heptosyltransferase I